MEFSEEWKSLWPICSAFSSPLLLSGPSSKPLGPLFFNPSPQTLTPLFSSPSVCPPFSPHPHLSISQFIKTSSDWSVPPTVTTSLAKQLGHHFTDNSTATFLNSNNLQLLRCPNDDILVFFPSGNNSDRVGYIVLTVRDSNLMVKFHNDGDAFLARKNLNHGICKLLVRPALHSGFGLGFPNCIGFLLACTMYTVHWFRIETRAPDESTEKPPALVHVGDKLFKCLIADACWSPHLNEECLVLLKGGEIFLFDADFFSRRFTSDGKFEGKRLGVSWADICDSKTEGEWLGCEFSWHPRIFIVTHSSAVFLVDLRSESCNVSCLMKASLGMNHFVLFSKSGSDGFYFTVATDSRLLLCDIRKPQMPLLQWDHNIVTPCFLNVYKLSDLRSNSKEDNYKWASQSGYCILMGSLWNCECSLFCYGPSPKGTVSPNMSKLCNSFYAWCLPYELSLSARECHCGSCLVREEFAKASLREWVDWQLKKEIVLGFGILDSDISCMLSNSNDYGGFTVIRLMSSAKLEAQNFVASWHILNKLEEAHEKESPFTFDESLLHCEVDEEYKFLRENHLLKLGYVRGYLNGKLTELIFQENKAYKGAQKKEKFNFHEFLCPKLQAFGLAPAGSPISVLDVFKDVNLPTSAYEVTLRKLWMTLPMEFLQLAFSNYSELLKVRIGTSTPSLEFLPVPDTPQLPPFLFRNPSPRGNHWSKKVRRNNGVVGPVIPLPVLLTLHKFDKRKEGEEEEEEKGYEYSPEEEITSQCHEVMKVVYDDNEISLGDDKELLDTSQKQKPFIIYNQDASLQDNDLKEKSFGTFTSKRADAVKMDGLDFFDDLCPVNMGFVDRKVSFGEKELKSYKLLKKQFSNWQSGFKPYQDFIAREHS